MSHLFAQSPLSDVSLDDTIIPTPEHKPIYNLSLFIPRVFVNISSKRITQIFHSLRIGKVNRVDFLRKRSRNGRPYNAMFVHFEHWYDNTAACNFQARVRDPTQDARLVYDDPWYWVVLENKSVEAPVDWEQYNEW
jgi:hypothetical protein